MSAELQVEFQLDASVRGFAFDVRFVAPPGITVLFGPSGAGKSTTLCVVGGLLHPTQGRIALGAEPWVDVAAGVDRAIESRSVGYVFQSLALFPHLSAVGNVEYGIDRRLSRAERQARAEHWLAKMKVGHLAQRRPSTYSGGEGQRVALARAFARGPAVVLLDEAFSSLDRPLREALNQDVRRAIDEAQVPAILVTHDAEEARAIGDRVIRLDRGRVAAAGHPEHILAAPAP